MKYNPTIHNRRSIRLKNYDYSQQGIYFITICCNHKEHLFGEIINNEMILNANGNIAYNEWLKTTQIRLNVELDVFVIMPNHMHAIIIINNPEMDIGRGLLHTPCSNNPHVAELKTNANLLHPSENHNVLYTSSENDTHAFVNKQGVFNTPLRSPSNTIGSIVRGYKSSVTKQINVLCSEKYDQSSVIWQRNFYEHIIRDERSYQNISDYIVNNPFKWESDKFYKS